MFELDISFKKLLNVTICSIGEDSSIQSLLF